ncbi:uncharacterized protein LOC121428847 [Lytechinus variegatus]|uniref:uncharacterized protein LOC121428847 n=1 Tax=Lytechinus variegatus TaxID=7654 RepID=UPI001BB1AB4D|nr:uncharacterized protein LOC121428847 [Lytechinus variegatus]
MEEGRKLTEEQYEIYETTCRRIDKFLQKFTENRSLKDIDFNEGDSVLEFIDQLDQKDVKSAIIKYFASCNEVFGIFTLVWESLVSSKISNLFNSSKLANLLLGIGNLTDFSYDFGYAFGEKGLLTLLLRDIKTKNLGDRQTSFALTFIYNCCWRVPENRIICREYVDTLQVCAQSKDPEIQADAFLTLSYIVDKSEVHKISLNEPCLKFLLLALKSALGSPDGRSPVGYSTFELLQGLNQLTINDSNKLLVVKLGGIEVLERILARDGSSNEEKHWAARGVWQLAFKESNKVKIRHSKAIISALNKIRETTDHFRLKEACASALFVINDVLDIDDESEGHASTRGEHSQRSVRSEESAGHGEEGHVMISYQHASQDRMLLVKSYLEEHGYHVWMDVDKMKGDILDSMAKAVQRAEVVLVCMSHRFKESQHCRTEATYAYTLNKAIVPLMLQDGFSPEDWLGALMGMKRYYPVFSDDLMRQSLPDLIKELGDRGKREKTNIMIMPSLVEVTGSSPVIAHGQRSQEKRAGDDTDGNGGIKDNPLGNQELLHSSSYAESDNTCIATWNVEETMEWLRSQGVDTNNDSFKKVDGIRLRQIKNLLNLAPEFCLKSLKEEMGLSFWDALSLVDALEKLGG